MPPTRARTSGPSASPVRVRAARRTLSNETNRIGSRRVVRSTHSAAPSACVAAPTAHLHDLFQLEKERVQASQMRERTERDQRHERLRMLDEQLVEARRTANENRAPTQGWRGFNDYEVELLRAEHQRQTEELHARLHMQVEEMEVLRAESARHAESLAQARASEDALRSRVAELEELLATHDTRSATLATEAAASAERAHVLAERLAEAEVLRRRLHNQVQELRGNIRVYARVRPPRDDGAIAELRYPDALQLATQIEVRAPSGSATGAASVKAHSFAFDHVFPPSATQTDVFEHVSDLLQSVLDGYHTTIFAYGQTGSGKTHTLEGGTQVDWTVPSTWNGDDVGLIPRAMHMLWDTAQAQQVHGWTFAFEAQMVEVYLDQITDLLGDHARCDVVHTGHQTHVEPADVVPLARPEDVYALLARAKQRRQVAATKMNERSSRSHSVFALRVRGTHTNGETTDATLHLVDLAGSERLASSGSAADPRRLREAQSINKSLSSLADVMGALATHAKHVPYRNSTLTWLLKPCLSHGAKTCVLCTYDRLMLLALSPLQAHLSETLCSLRFATQVHGTHLGPARTSRQRAP